MDSKIFFSAKENTFFFESMKSAYESAGSWPDDLREVTTETYQLYAGEKPPEGKQRGADGAGQPVWIDVPELTKEQLIALAIQQRKELVESANVEIAWRQDAVDADIATEEEITGLTEWKKYRVLLMRLDTGNAPDISWPPRPSTGN
ncbi:tail fiber protein [Citrobacter braakii]|uniref:Tail fiber protein n=1 Tax=Citrobacter braakii TaxID=57706 RepID=A0AAD1P2C5_CITBR|nr:tail fiber assembly protein [Citrobacter braakii]BDN97314.1 tail fiber protein [Citrobacter braakii]HEE0062743.1 tail fiber assembly protein [Citrobacter braakii]HEE9823252.1 tail fiber assembly protein [Citrobacter braakii]